MLHIIIIEDINRINENKYATKNGNPDYNNFDFEKKYTLIKLS